MRNPLRQRGALAALLYSIVVTIGAHSVWAQDQSDEGESLSVDEVVVTARRAEERLLDVPLAVTAFTTEQIESQGIRNLDDIAALTPGLTFSNLIGEFLPVPVIRGVAPVNIFGENNAAIFVDGIYVSGREGLNFSQLDLQEINIVKGPQAALYGRNAFSGAINYVTAKPTSELRGKAEAQIGNDGKALGQFSVSGPVLGERLQGRLAVAYDRWDGSYTNRIANGPDIGGYEYKTAQASLRFATSERFEGLLSLYYSDDKIGPPAMSEVLANCENRNLVDPMQSSKWMNYCGKLPTVNADSLAVIAGADGEDRELTRVHLNLKWNVLGGTLTSLSGYSNTEQSYFEDGTRGTGIATYIYATTAPTPTTPRPIRTFQATLKQIGLGDTTEELSQELRFASASGERLRWSAGLYYYDTKAEGGNDGVIAAPALPSDFASFCPCVMITPTLGFPTPGASAGANATFIPWFTDPLGGAFPLAVRADVEAYSAFGSIDYDFTERLTGRVEARWTDESKESTTFNASGAVLRRFEDSWQIPNWRATVDFKPRTDVMFYGSIARAEKSGDFGTGTVRFVSDPNTQVTVGQPYDPEVLLAYELGFKGRFFDGRFQTEFDIFWNDWSDIVIPQVVTEVNGQPIVQPTSFEINAGDATVKGVEWSFVARLTPRLRINGGISLTNAEYDNARIQTFALFPSFAPDGNVSGNKILRQSEEQFTLGLGYEAPLRETLRWYLRSDLAYRGKQFADAANQIVVPEQTLLNTSIGLRGEQWQVELWGRNLTHEDAPTGAFRDVAFTNFAPNLPFAGGGSFFPFRLSVSHPRLTTYGVTVRFNF